MNFNKKITEDQLENVLEDISSEVLSHKEEISSDKKTRIYNKMLDHYNNSLKEEKTMSETKAPWLKNLVLVFSGMAVAVFAFVAFNFWQSSETVVVSPEQQEVLVQNNEELNNLVQLAGTVALAEGNVETRQGEEWLAVEIGMDVKENDLIRTRTDSRAIINFDDGSAVRLDANTQIEITECNNSAIALEQSSGQIYNRVNKGELIYSVTSLDTRITALGTAFTINRNHTDQVIVKVLESKVKIEEENKEEVEELLEGEIAIIDKVADVITKDSLNYDELQDDFYKWNKEEDVKLNQPLGVLAEVPPALTIESPGNNYRTYNTTVELKGYTEADAKLYINGEKIETEEGKFSKTISLSEGENKIIVKAENEFGKITEEKILVYRDKKEEVKEDSTYVPPTGIKLTASSSNGKVYLNWSLSNMASAKGFKVVVNETGNPVYPGNTYHYYSSPSKTADTWSDLTNGKTYHFRVCEYLGGKCGTYSNDITITVKGGIDLPDNTNGSISLKGSIDANGKVSLNWSLANMTSLKGFKIVSNKTGNPVYPGSTYHYLSNPSTSTDTWTNLEAGKTYYFRACEYLGGKCGVYSNQLSFTVPAAVVPDPDPVQDGSIYLSASVTDGKVYLNWSLTDMTSAKGFKVVVNETGSPVYPGSTYHYLSSPSVVSDTWTDLSPGKTYYIRVCEYLGGACGVYSNQITATIPTAVAPDPDPVQDGSIYLSTSVQDGKVYLNWSLADMTSPSGFKVVVNETGSPTYPGSTYHYLSSSSATSDTWIDLTVGKTYYFRVCEYLGGACGVYSNQGTVTIPAAVAPDPDPVQDGSIYLSASVTDGKVNLNWSLTDMTSPSGFKVVVNKTGSPVYPGDTYHFYSDSSVSSDVWTDLEAGYTYYFRVCEYLGGVCGVYSNQMSATISQ